MPIWLPIALLFFGIVALLAGLKNFFDQKATLSWEETQGVIKSSAVVRKHKANFVSVEYRYQVDGEPYEESEDSTWGTNSPSRRSWRRLQARAAKYHAGQYVSVYFDPEEPANSTLSPGFKTDTPLIVLIGLLLTCAGTVLLFIYMGWDLGPLGPWIEKLK